MNYDAIEWSSFVSRIFWSLWKPNSTASSTRRYVECSWTLREPIMTFCIVTHAAFYFNMRLLI